MPEIVCDSIGFALGVIWPHENGWVAKLFIQTHTIKVESREVALRWINSHTAKPAPQQIGVEDYDTLVELLSNEFARTFPDYGPTDPQNMVQRMAAEILNLRGLGVR